MKIEYFFDVISPYSCFSWKILQRYKAIWNLELRPVPMFLGGVMKGTGNKPPAMLPARSLFLAGDMMRSRAFYDIPILDTPSNFFTNVARDVINCQRVLVAASMKPSVDLESLIDSFTNGVHLDEEFRNESNELFINDDFLKKCCARAGLSEALTSELLAKRNSAEVKASLIKNTEEAMEAGAFGSPTMVVHGGKAPFEEPFMVFGSDRFGQIAHCCGKPYFGPVPNRPQSSL